MFKKLLIANRGEIACRIIKTAKKMNIRTVAVYSEIDAHALHVQLADDSVCIGRAPSIESYLVSDKIIQAAINTGAEAVHPGYGFLSEDADFAEQLQQAGLIFVGPSAHAIRTMGDKNLAKTTLAAAGVPVVPGYHGEQTDLAIFKKMAQEIGFPVLIKASAGGGGKGMRLVENPDQLAEAIHSAMREAQASFGDARVFIEKYLANARHIEVQILFDQYGQGVYLFDRDCSIQRRHQKIIEEAPAAGLTELTKRQMADTALRAGAAINYYSTGTIEFLVDEHEDFYFMEMNTRLQVEHPVTEMITGLDLVEWQLRIAAGEQLTLNQADIKIQGHAIEARLYAENPQNNFMPSAGTLKYFQLPQPTADTSIRVDSGFQAKDIVSVYYDPLLAKLIAWGADRLEAIATLQQLLNQTAVVGIHTNLSLLSRIAHYPQFIQGKITTHFILLHHTQLLSQLTEIPPDVINTAAAAILRQQQIELSYFRQHSADCFSPWLIHDNWRLNQPVQSFISFWQNGKNWRIPVDSLASSAVDQKKSTITYIEDNQITIFCDGEQWEFTLINLANAVDTGQSEIGLRAPMPGVIVEIYVQSGQVVAAGERLLVMEAMKMEHALFAPYAGKIQNIFYQPGDRINEGVQLIEMSQDK